MSGARHSPARPGAQVFQFDDAVLDACGSELRTALLTEAAMLAEAFAPEGRADQLLAMAEAMTTGARATRKDGDHARQLACALRRLAREADV